MQYHVVVELQNYDGNKIAEMSCTCNTDISDESIIAAARIAGELMVKYHTGVTRERRVQERSNAKV